MKRLLERIVNRLPWHVHVHHKLKDEYLVYQCRCGSRFHDHDWVW